MSRYTTVIGDSTDDETNRERADHSGAHLTVRVEGADGDA